MQLPDMNLLVALDALLDEGSVVGAARRMNLSPAAMSRTLTRIREAVGDPILVRAGRGLVPTPKALQLQGQVRNVVEQAAVQSQGVWSLQAISEGGPLLKARGAQSVTQALLYTPGMTAGGFADRVKLFDEPTSRGFSPTPLYLDGLHLP